MPPQGAAPGAGAARAEELLASFGAKRTIVDRDQVASELASLGAAAVPVLAAAVESRAPTMGLAAKVLLWIGEPARPALPALVAILADRGFVDPAGTPRNAPIRAGLIEAASEAGWGADLLAAPLAAIALEAREAESDRVRATSALGAMGEAALPTLASIVDDESLPERVRQYALHALRQIGAPALPVVRKLAEREGHPLQDRARGAFAQLQEEAGGPTRATYYGELVDAHPDDERVRGWLQLARGYGGDRGSDELALRILARWRAALAAAPDGERAEQLAFLVQDQLDQSNLDASLRHGYRGKRLATENHATLAVALDAMKRASDPQSPRWQRALRGAAKLALIRGDWDGMNAALVELGQAPVPAAARPFLPPPPKEWDDLAARWGACHEAMRSGDGAFEVQVEKDGRGLRGVHVVVRLAPADPFGHSSGVDLDTLFWEAEPLAAAHAEAASGFGWGGEQRLHARYAVTEDAGLARFERLPQMEATVEVLVPTGNFTEPGSKWDLWRRGADGTLTPVGYGGNDAFAIEPGKTVRGLDLVVLPCLDWSVADGAPLAADGALLEWAPPPGVAEPLAYELELSLGFPLAQVALRGADEMARLATGTARIAGTRFELSAAGVGGVPLAPGNLYTLELRARDGVGRLVARYERRWLYVPWSHRASEPPRSYEAWQPEADNAAPLDPQQWCRGEYHGRTRPFGGGRPRVETLSQRLERFVGEQPRAFEREYVEVVQAWLVWRAGDAATARARLAALIAAVPPASVVGATAADLAVEIDGGATPRERLDFHGATQ